MKKAHIFCDGKVPSGLSEKLNFCRQFNVVQVLPVIIGDGTKQGVDIDEDPHC